MIVDGRVLEEPAIVPGNIGRDLLPLGRSHARVAHPCREGTRLARGILELTRSTRGLDRSDSQALLPEAPLDSDAEQRAHGNHDQHEC